MSKRTIIIAILAIVLFISSLISLNYDKREPILEPDAEQDPEPDPEPEQEPDILPDMEPVATAKVVKNATDNKKAT